MPDGTLEETIQRLSPAALDIFREQLPLRLKQMGELERNTALERLRQLPELFEPERAIAPRPEPEEIPWWQHPLQWLRGVETGFGAVVTAPFTPAVPGAERLPWFERERAEYAAWEEPGFEVEPLFRLPWTPEEIRREPWLIGIKGAIETAPWFGTMLATGGLAALGWAGKVGRVAALTRAATVGQRALKPVITAERAVTALPFKAIKGVISPLLKPIESLGQRLAAKTLPDTARFIAPANEIYERQITTLDWQRKVAEWFGRKPFFKNITEATGGKAAVVGRTEAVEDVAARAMLIAPRVQKDLLSKGQVALANLRGISQDPIRLFGVDEATGLTRIKGRVSGLSKHIDDIAEHPTKYILTPQQKSYIQELHNVEDWVLDGLKTAGVDVKLLKFDEFSHWAHRVVLGKKVDGKFVELRRGFGRIGSKQSFEKTRFYQTAQEGLEQGVVYSPSLEHSLDLYVQSAAKRIADSRIAQAVSAFGEKPLERAMRMFPEVMAEARETARILAGARQLVKVVNRAIRGEKLTEATLRAQERRFPELGKLVRGAIGDKEALKKLVTEAKAMEEVAKAPYWKARAARVAKMEIARTPSVGKEAVIMHPAFQGKIYPAGIAGEIQKYWADLGFSPLQKAATMSGAMRTLVAAADFSAPWIQGVTGMALHPKAWGSGVKLMFQAFKNSKTYQEFFLKNLDDAMEFAHHGGYLGGFEFMEAMPTLQRAGRFVGALAGRPRAGEAAIRQTYGRFEAAFGAFGDAYRVNMWKALRGRAKNADELAEIARHIDRMSGVMSTKGLGIGRTQRDFETAFIFFAPRYTRAGFALVGDMFKGGLTGAEARKALGSMMAAGAAFYTGTCMALGQEPNFDPSTGKFMTIEITDPITGTTRHFGIGGMMTSMARLGADVTASALSIGMNEPQDFVKLSRFDNPFMRFMFSKSAPLTGFMEGLLFGHNYFGEPFENIGDYMAFMGEQVMPIALQAAFMEEGGLAPTAIAAEEAGMRTFPRSDWEKRDVIRDRVAQERFGMSWDDLGTRMGRLYQEQLLRDTPELREATELASETSSRMARGEGKVWDNWRKEGVAVEDRYKEAIRMASGEFGVTRDGTTFRQKVDEALSIRRAMYASREKDPQYLDVYDYFNDPLEASAIAKMNPKDLARREYYQIMYAPDMYDEFGNYLFEEADRREAYFVQKYGQSVLDYVEEYMGAKWEEPPEMRMLRQARLVLRSYWDIERLVWNNYPAELKQISDQILILERTDPMRAKQALFQYPAILMARRLVALYRRQLKMRSPDAAEALAMFYRY